MQVIRPTPNQQIHLGQHIKRKHEDHGAQHGESRSRRYVDIEETMQGPFLPSYSQIIKERDAFSLLFHGFSIVII